LSGQVQLTLIHTGDIHSRLFPYNLQLGQIDAGLGLGATGAIVNTGGAARVSHVVGRERARAERVLHLDAGDCFQGAPIFNFFSGEPEVRTMSAMGVDAAVVANHEFDRGAVNLGVQLQRWADYPVLAANYLFTDPTVPGASSLGGIVKPFTVFDVKGLRVGVIGMGNLSSLTSVFDTPNRLGITPLNTAETAQFYVDLLRREVDVVVIISHLGLDADELMIQTTTGVDVVLGGHNHIVLQPPKQVQDCSAYSDTAPDGSTRHFIPVDRAGSGQGDVGCKVDADCGADGYCYGGATALVQGTAYTAVAEGTALCKQKRYCTPRNVVLSHPGAFAKYVGRHDLVFSNDPSELPATYDPLDGFELISNQYTLLPITDQTPEDPVVSSMLEPYQQSLDALGNLELLVGYAYDGSKRVSTSGGDSPLGNLVATAMWQRLGIQTDFSLTNTTGIRTDLVAGPVTVDEMYDVFPFDNSITKMELSGYEVQELFDYVARRSSGRGCISQVQIAGARVVMDCTQGCLNSSCGPGQTCDPNAGVCVDAGLCSPSIVCEPGETCDPMSGTCVTQALGVATHIYIGPFLDSHNQPLHCSTDQDCPGQGPNQCDQNAHVCYQPIQPISEYEMATSNYLGAGGSGFIVLQHNTTQNNTQVQQRDALIDYIRAGFPCGSDGAGNLVACSTDQDCVQSQVAGDGFVCACPQAVTGDTGLACQTKNDPGCGGKGQCVLQKCRDDVANFQRQICQAAPTKDIQTACLNNTSPCTAGGEQCKFLACIDKRLGNYSDGRLLMVGQ
jgi:5'-nucleotidase